MRQNQCDDLEKCFERTEGQPEWRCDGSLDCYMARQQDRRNGINAEPTDGPRDGVRYAQRMHPNDYIPNGRG